MQGTKIRLHHWIIAFVVVAAFFYGMDYFVMKMQGLPLNLDLSPAR